MTDLKSAFSKLRGARKAVPQGNVILRVTEIGDKTIKGEIMNGASAGDMIEILPKGHLAIADYKKGKTKVNPGDGLLRVEGLKEGRDGVYDTRWVKTFIGKPNDKQMVLNDAQLSLYPSMNRDGTPRRDVNGAQIMNLMQIHPEGEVVVKSADEFRAASVASIRDGRTAALIGVNAAEGFFHLQFMAPAGAVKDGKYEITETPADVANRLISNMGGDEAFNSLLETATIAVVPVTRLNVGSDTSMSIETNIKEKGEDALISTIDPKDFTPPSIGIRMINALRAAGPEKAAQVQEAFLAQASEAAKTDFLTNNRGFAGVAAHDVEAFLKGNGVELADRGDKAWSKNSLLLQQRYDNSDSMMAIKTFRTGAISHYPVLAVTKDLNAAVRDELVTGIDKIIEGLRASGKLAEAPAATKADEAVANPAEAAPAGADVDNIDDLLDQLADEELGA